MCTIAAGDFVARTIYRMMHRKAIIIFYAFSDSVIWSINNIVISKLHSQ